MSRLLNVEKSGGYEYRVVLDADKASTNYIERTKGVFFSKADYDHKCLKCLTKSLWLNWIKENYVKDVCKCGQVQSLEILVNFSQEAK